MSLELLKTIEQAEAQAEKIRQDAQKQARELIVAAEKRCAEDAARDVARRRAEAQNTLRSAREIAERKIAQEAAQQAKERAAACDRARGRLDQAAVLIFERIVGNGDR